MTKKSSKKVAKTAKSADEKAIDAQQAVCPPEVIARIEALEENQRTLRKAFEFAANECRPLFNFGPLALIFDAIAEKLQK